MEDVRLHVSTRIIAGLKATRLHTLKKMTLRVNGLSLCFLISYLSINWLHKCIEDVSIKNPDTLATFKCKLKRNLRLGISACKRSLERPDTSSKHGAE